MSNWEPAMESWDTTGMVEIDFEAIPDEHNAALVERLADANGVWWPAVPRVGDLISFEDGMTATVKAVFWDFPKGTVMVRVR